jgi:hypothetical protein
MGLVGSSHRIMDKTMNHKQISSKGGQTTKARYGVEHFSRLGKLGGAAKLKMYGPDYFRKISAIAVRARQKKP